MKETELYTKDEVLKLIEAYKVKYSISDCDEYPYLPKPINVTLIGSVRNQQNPIIDEKMLTDLSDLDLSRRVYFRLKAMGLKNVGDLLNTSRMQMYKQIGFGKKSWVQVRDEVRKLGFEIPIR